MPRATTSMRRRESGFTLIELMISVAIIGVLATIAVPAFNNFQNKSRRSEAFANLSAIAKLQKSYYGSNDVFADTIHSGDASWPGQGSLGTAKRKWTADSETAFGALGFDPNGAVFYDYEVNVDTGACPDRDCFTATAYGDVDGNGQLSVIQYVQKGADGTAVSVPVYEPGLGVPTEPTSGRERDQEVAVNYSADQF